MAIDHDAVIAAEGEALAAAGEAGDADAAVPGTDWTLTDLLDHVGRLNWYWAGRLRTAGGGEFYDLERAEATDRPTWIREGLAAMRSQLSAAAEDAEVKTWAGTLPPSWLWRRMTHELTVHRWDAEAAAGGAPTPIDVEVATDGIDEYLSEFTARFFGHEAFGDDPATLHLHATDGDGEWFVEVGPDAVAWERAHQKGDVALRGATGDLLLVLWGRLPTDAVEVIGDEDVLARWRSATHY